MSTLTGTRTQRLWNTLVWASVDLLATFATFFAVVRRGLFGTTWVLGMAAIFASTIGVAVASSRSRVAWLASTCIGLGALRALSVWVDSNVVTVPAWISLWLVAGALVGAVILWTASSLGAPLWRDRVADDGTGTSLVDSLWLSIVARPAAMFVLPFFIGAPIWGFHWSHPFRPCFGFTLSSTVVLAAIVSLCYLVGSLLGIERRLRTEAGPPDAAIRGNGAKFWAGLVIFCLWGLAIESRTTQRYILWTLLMALAALVSLVFHCLRRLAPGGQRLAIVASPAWPRAVLVLHVLWVALLSLLYGDLLFCLLR